MTVNLTPIGPGYWWRWKPWGRGEPKGRWYAVEVVLNGNKKLCYGCGHDVTKDGLWGGVANKPKWIPNEN